jgi:hypothetical protein
MLFSILARIHTYGVPSGTMCWVHAALVGRPPARAPTAAADPALRCEKQATRGTYPHIQQEDACVFNTTI